MTRFSKSIALHRVSWNSANGAGSLFRQLHTFSTWGVTECLSMGDSGLHHDGAVPLTLFCISQEKRSMVGLQSSGMECIEADWPQATFGRIAFAKDL